MMDGRDGEAMAARHGTAADNGVRLPTDNTVSHNVFANYGVWDKQSAAYEISLSAHLYRNAVEKRCCRLLFTEPPRLFEQVPQGAGARQPLLEQRLL